MRVTNEQAKILCSPKCSTECQTCIASEFCRENGVDDLAADLLEAREIIEELKSWMRDGRENYRNLYTKLHFCKNDLAVSNAIIEKQTELIKEMLPQLVYSRAGLEAYEAESTGETYNSPSLNSIIEKAKEYI